MVAPTPGRRALWLWVVLGYPAQLAIASDELAGHRAPTELGHHYVQLDNA